MKTQIIFVCVLGAIASVLGASISYDNQPEITDREIQTVKLRLECVLDIGPCDIFGIMAKEILPEILMTRNCSKCSPEIQQGIERIFYIMHKKFPNELNQLFQKFVPNAVQFHTRHF